MWIAATLRTLWKTRMKPRGTLGGDTARRWQVAPVSARDCTRAGSLLRQQAAKAGKPEWPDFPGAMPIPRRPSWSGDRSVGAQRMAVKSSWHAIANGWAPAPPPPCLTSTSLSPSPAAEVVPSLCPSRTGGKASLLTQRASDRMRMLALRTKRGCECPLCEPSQSCVANPLCLAPSYFRPAAPPHPTKKHKERVLCHQCEHRGLGDTLQATGRAGSGAQSQAGILRARASGPG